jgi:hypothetical protein
MKSGTPPGKLSVFNMTLDIKPFIDLLKRRDAKRAREWFDSNRGQIYSGKDFEKGYLLALQGMVDAIESGGELSAINKLLEKKFTDKELAEFTRETKDKLSQKFRPEDERGFYSAWIDVIRELGEKT